jgi:hypothetical protein
LYDAAYSSYPMAKQKFGDEQEMASKKSSPNKRPGVDRDVPSYVTTEP